MRNISNILWGILLVVLGFIFGLNALEITNIDVFFDGWWTLFIIVPCFIDLFNDNDKTGNIIGLVVGISLLLACQDFIDFSLILKLIVPFIIVMIGLSLIFKDLFFKKVEKKFENNKNLKECSATFSGQTLKYDNEVFEGCSLNAVFGCIDYDLSNAIINEDVVINTSSIFGGIDIKVPKDVNVKVTSTTIFGGVDLNKHKNVKDAKVTIYLNATCIFGGVDIK